MRMLNKFKKFGLTISTLAILTFACSCGAAATATPPASATAPVSLTEMGPLTPDFTQIDEALKEASLAVSPTTLRRL